MSGGGGNRQSGFKGRKNRLRSSGRSTALAMIFVLSAGWPAALGGDSAAIPTAGPSPAPAADQHVVQDVVYFAAKRPMFIRFRIQIDGHGFLERRDKLSEKMFGSLDKNGDGSLDAEEAKNTPSVLQLLPPDDPEALRVRRTEIPDGDGNGAITLAEFREYIGRVAGRPFEITAESPRSRVRTNLFARLDADGDGALTTAELERGQQVLSRDDVNDDEIVSAAELNPDPQAAAAVAEETAVRSLTSLLLVVDRARPSDACIRRLLQIYDKFSRDPETGFFSKNGQLSAAELGLESSALGGSDGDADGQLTAAELREFLKNPPADMELVANVVSGDRQKAEFQIATPSSGASAQAIEASQTGAGRVTVVLGGIKADLDPAVDVPAKGDLASQYTQLFQAFDGDNNDYLDPTEFNNLGASFPAVDADRDQKIFLKELLAYLEIQSALAEARTALVVSNESKTLFDVLDGDADGRLSRRELSRAQSRIDTWDADGDGRVAVAEIPSNYRMQFAIGRPVLLGNAARFQQQGMGVQAAMRPKSGPLWFQKMDRNGDGDVSQREFLGPLEAYTRLDADGDGLIDATEAAAAG